MKLPTNTMMDLVTFSSFLSVILNILDFFEITVFNILRPSNYKHELQRGISHSSLTFYINYAIYIVTLMFALVGYNSLKLEMCFHCKWGFFAMQTLSVLVQMFFVMEYFPWFAIGLSVVLFVIVVTVRQMNLDERRKKHVFKMK